MGDCLEQDLIAQVQTGNHDAFERLIRLHEKRVYTIALRMTGDTEDAFDVSQDILLRVYSNIGMFKGESSFSTWLYRLATNVCLDFLRKRKRRRARETSLDGDEGGEVRDMPDTRYTPEKAFEKLELREEIRRALDRISPEHRQILLLREISGLSYTEISKALGLEIGTVKSRIARAREQMRVLLTPAGNISV
ncbi:MAG: sigma-70 family RNA polymerase sigma factor [Oscillospiraceae bacterium]|nr:sigma-70 family RNA polymerase sigma factor [Oscillospiraceae bacterium]